MDSKTHAAYIARFCIRLLFATHCAYADVLLALMVGTVIGSDRLFDYFNTININLCSIV